ncbi:Maf family protein [Arcanobacterium buesumense]|uniref:Nucleoside triphosphate pyrophosphatase n=1 Tax=Arcanobacterium buesumense TaxID=2722751 RepID=A0A6H2EMQ0_9ACTO|nr:nucleoside triphosphate pyrophosphatase [Arcanobacterium buesumense]QJC22349.1 septum formation inhibitor Maf [Arcanobacterium buesumense]
MKKLLLGSASPARRQTLINAGITPIVRIADLDEDAIINDFATNHAELSLRQKAQAEVQLLATSKAQAIYALVKNDEPAPTVVVGCDSMLEMNGRIAGKPHTPDIARQRLREMSGKAGYLHTGHCVIDTASGRIVEGVSTATVHIAHLTDHDIEAYIATGEPLNVAGSFTIDGFGGPFVERIEGDYHGIVGLSLPLLRTLLAELGHSITEFWSH